MHYLLVTDIIGDLCTVGLRHVDWPVWGTLGRCLYGPGKWGVNSPHLRAGALGPSGAVGAGVWECKFVVPQTGQWRGEEHLFVKCLNP